MSVSPFDDPMLSGLLGDAEMADLLSADAQLRAMLRFEAALAEAEAEAGVIPAAAAQAIVAALGGFDPDVAAIATATARDGTVGVELVRQLRRCVGPPHDQLVHFGATSQDVVDTGLILRLKEMLPIFASRLHAIIAAIAELEQRFGANRLMGRTRMQDALPITASDRLSHWSAPLARHLDRLEELSPRLLRLQFGGAVGTLDKLGDKRVAVATALAARLGLAAPERSWHTERDGVVEFAGWLSLVSGSLGKIGADAGLMAQNSVGELTLQGGGASSAMPHKHNPIAAEVLVALAAYAAVLAGGMQATLVHEQERSGARWMLEWLLLPQLLMTTAAGLRTASTLLGQITHMGSPA